MPIGVEGLGLLWPRLLGPAPFPDGWKSGAPLPHLPAPFGRDCNHHPLSEHVALLIKTFPPQGFSAEWHWLQARAAEDSRIVLVAESLPREELLALYGCAAMCSSPCTAQKASGAASPKPSSSARM